MCFVRIVFILNLEVVDWQLLDRQIGSADSSLFGENVDALCHSSFSQVINVWFVCFHGYVNQFKKLNQIKYFQQISFVRGQRINRVYDIFLEFIQRINSFSYLREKLCIHLLLFFIDYLKLRMLTAPSSRAEQLIYQRRAQEQKLSTMQTKLKQEFHQQEFAKWQNKSKNIEINYQVKQRLAAVRQQANSQLLSRRRNLTLLLENEDKVYREQILAAQETPEQTRERMAKRVKELKQQKQARRQEEVNSKLDKRFQQNADELRKVDQDLKELRTAYERNIQMVEKQNQLQNQYQEQVLFAELNRRDIKKKEELQKIKKQQHQQKIEERNAILAIQKDLKKRKQEQEKYLSAREKQMLRWEWERQTELAKLKERQIIDKQKDVNKVLIEQNQRIKRDKQEKIRAEKIADREMIQRIVLKQRQLAEYQKLLKEKEREQSKKSLQGFRNKNQQLLAYEKELDRLIEAERQKKQKKQQEEWEKREKARVNLLYQVFDDRERKVRQHKAEKDEELKTKEQDKIEIENRIRQFQEEQERKKREEFERNRREQENLLKQIALKEEKRRLILLQLQKEDKNEESARNQYNRKIEDRKQQGRQTLQNFKNTNRLF